MRLNCGDKILLINISLLSLPSHLFIFIGLYHFFLSHIPYNVEEQVFTKQGGSQNDYRGGWWHDTKEKQTQALISPLSIVGHSLCHSLIFLDLKHSIPWFKSQFCKGSIQLHHSSEFWSLTMPQPSKEPCKKEACDIQACLSKNNFLSQKYAPLLIHMSFDFN